MTSSTPHHPQVDLAEIDVLLVGDSVAMVVHGHDTTLPITLGEMLVHCKAVARGARRAFLVGGGYVGRGGVGWGLWVDGGGGCGWLGGWRRHTGAD